MERIYPNNLLGINAYFTGFDHRIIKNYSNIIELQKIIERNIKILLLTKHNIVCAASHLTNDIAFNLFSNNPILLNSGLIIPAFRQDKNDISELFESINIDNKIKQNRIRFYKENLSKTVYWELKDTASWFQNAFIQGLLPEKSVMRNNLKYISKKQMEEFIFKIQEKKILTREYIDGIIDDFDDSSKLIIKNYRELIYNISGARSVNCQSTLPQENYIDYSLTDLETNRTQLSETQIFWKIYIETILNKTNGYPFPIDYLDSLSFEKIYKIRKSILDSWFINKYNEIYNKSINAIKKENELDILYNAYDLIKIGQSMRDEYNNAIDDELPKHYNRKYRDRLIRTICRFLLNIAPNQVLSTLMDIKPLILDILTFQHNPKGEFNYRYNINRKENFLSKRISEISIHNGSEMIDLGKEILDILIEQTKPV